MNEREKLIELIDEAINDEETSYSNIADYLLANGVVVPMFQKSDIVYHLAHGYANEERVRCVDVKYLTNGYDFRPEDIGKTVFLSCEDAEKALEERKEK